MPALLLATVGLPLVATDTALGAPCTDYGNGRNHAVQVTPALSVSSDDGVHGQIYEYSDTAINLGVGDDYLPALQIFHAADNFIDYGYRFQHIGPSLTSIAVVDARYWGGDYAIREHSGVGGDTVYFFDPRYVSFRFKYNTSDSRYDFVYDGNDETYHRDPPWRYGQAVGTTETYDTCNTSISQFKGLQLRLSGTWYSWSGTDWCYDDQPNWGYDDISNTAYGTSHRTDDYTGINSSHC